MIFYFQQQGSQQFDLPLHENNIGRSFVFSGVFRKEVIISNLHIDSQTHLKPIFRRIHIQQL